MGTKLKLVCIGYTGATNLEIGGVYMTFGDPENYAVKILNSSYTLPIRSKRFLRLPTEPKTCEDMSMEGYLAMVCLRSTDPSKVMVTGSTHPVTGTVMPSKADNTCQYYVKPDKSAKDIEIERIEGEMLKLAEALNKIKG